MNELESSVKVEDMIYEVRGVQVMLDSDLARLYQCKNGTKDINKAVKRNINRFPEDFYFQLTFEECSKFQFGTLNKKRGENIKYLPHVFTEQGVAMLASVLHTEVAEYTSVKIMRAFVKMKKYISNGLLNQNYINNMVLEHHEDIKLLKDSFSKLSEKQKVNTIFYNGQIFDAYVVLMEILENAKEEIIIIDDYAGKELFKILKDIDKKIIVITSNINKEDKRKYEKQYQNIEIKQDDRFHDRFIIVDRKILYHSGASFKDLGSKCCCISLIENEGMLHKLLKEINL